MDFGSTLLEHHEGVAVACLAGEHDLTTAEEVGRVLHGQAIAGFPIVVDLSVVDFVDSSVFSVFVSVNEQLQKTGQRLVLQLSESSRAFRPITMLSLHETFVCAPTRHEAIQAARDAASGTIQ